MLKLIASLWVRSLMYGAHTVLLCIAPLNKVRLA